MDSQTCTRFSGKVGHEPKDSWLTVRANWQKGAWQWEWPVTKRQVTSKWIHVTWPNFVETNTHTNTHTILTGHCLPRPFHNFSPVCRRLLWEAFTFFLSIHTVKKGFIIQTQYFASQHFCCWSQLLRICTCFFQYQWADSNEMFPQSQTALRVNQQNASTFIQVL